jgi:arabinofuranosyltransferase
VIAVRPHAGLGAAVLLTVAGRLYFGVMTSDDAFITYRYARNVVTHHAFVYNVGEPVLGTSTPLYGLIMTAVIAAGLPVESTSFLIGTACDAGIVIVLFSLMSAAGLERSAALGAALAGSVPLAIVPTSSGMETSLYGLLILLTVRAAAAAVTTGRTAGATALAIALGLCRPDGALALGVVVSGLFLARPRVAWRFLWPALVAGVVVGVVAWSYYGTMVPQSVVAKSAGAGESKAGVMLLGALLLSRFHAVTTALALLGAVALWRRALAWRWLVTWWVVYAAVFSLTGAILHADWYFVPLQSVYWGCAAAGLELTLARILAEPRARLAFALASFALVAMAVRGWPRHRAAFAQVHAIREEPYLEAGRRIASSDRPCSVAATEIGALGYAFPGRIIDLGGLTTPSAVGRPAVQVIEELDAQWLVTQNIYMPAGLAAAAEFERAFERTESRPLEPGRTLDVYKRRAGSCLR